MAWRCRRGLLELDVWLGGFLAAHRATLEPEALDAFERLLALPDMQIMDVLQSARQADDPALVALAGRIQNFRVKHDEQDRYPQL
jgi:succinate dehydrogenase flavin-adding protein (antitoxin of CptAB toxin-antitoxin module)